MLLMKGSEIILLSWFVLLHLRAGHFENSDTEQIVLVELLVLQACEKGSRFHICK